MADFLADAGTKAGKAANKRFQKKVKKSGTQQNKNVQPFSNAYDNNPYLAYTPPQQLAKQARQQVNAAIQAQIKNLNTQYTSQLQALNNQFNRQRTQGVADIGASAGSLTQAAQAYGPQVKAADEQMLSGQRTIDQGIQSFLANYGQQVVGGVTAQQQAAGAPAEALAATAAGPGQLALGIQGEALGRGGATQSMMLSQQAADTNYANFLPTLAGRAKEQDTGLFLRTLANQQAAAQGDVSTARQTALGNVTAQAPGLINDLYNNLYNQQVTTGLAEQAYGLDQYKTTTAAASGGAGVHWQHKTETRPNGSQVTYDWNPVTGERANVQTFPAAPGKGPTSHLVQQTMKSATSIAQKRLKTLGKTLYGSKDEFGILQGGTNDPKKRADILAGARQDVLGAVSSTWRQAFPKKSDAWIKQQVILALRSGGWRPYANFLETGKFQPQVTTPGGGGGKGGGGAGGGGGGGGKPAKPPSYPQSENTAPGAGGAAKKEKEKRDKAQQQAAEDAAAKANAPQAASGEAAKDVSQKLKGGTFAYRGVPYENNVKRVTFYITQHYENIPIERARAIARSALAPYYPGK